MRRANTRSGQAISEYTVVAGMVLASVVVLSLLLHVFKSHGWRLLNLVASEYP